MKFIIGISLIVHGAAHLVGFFVYWKIVKTEEMPYKTTLLGGRIDVGDMGIRLIGILWLLAALAFIAAGIGVISLQPWWYAFTLYLSIFSLALCITGWPDAKIGVFVNILIIAFLIIGAARGWLPLVKA